MASFRIGPRTAVALVLAAIVATELGLRATGKYGRETRYEPSERYGHRLIGGQERQSPRGVPIRINSDGFRDREWTGADERAVRIAVFGDSVTFGHDVAEESTWCRALEAQLDARERASGRRIVVQNYSVPSYGIEQSARVFEDLVAPTRPAVVVFTVAPYAVLPMQPRDDLAFIPLRRWILRAAIFEYIDDALHEMQRKEVAAAHRRINVQIFQNLYAPEHDPLWQAALERLDDVRLRVAEWNGRLVLLSTPVLEAFFKPPPPSRFEAWAKAHPDVLWIDPSPALGESMQPLLREMQARNLAMSDVWKRFEPGEPRPASVDTAVFFLDDGFHMNARGHGVVATAVAAALQQARLP